MSHLIDIFLLDNSNNIIEEVNIKKPKYYKDLISIINEKFNRLPKNYIIYFLSNDNKKTKINNNEEYKLTKDILFISEESKEQLVESLFQINYKNLSESKRDILDDIFSCILCTEAIKDENPFLCYKCQKIFHQKCLKDWDNKRKFQNQKLTCPNCRNELPLEKWNKKIDHKDNRKYISTLMKQLNEYSRDNNIKNIINELSEKRIKELSEELNNMKEKYIKLEEVTKKFFKSIIIQINNINSLFEPNLNYLEEKSQFNDLTNSILQNLEIIFDSIKQKFNQIKIFKNESSLNESKDIKFNKNIYNNISVIIRRKGIENKYTFEALNTIEYLIETVRKSQKDVKNTIELYRNNTLITDYFQTLQDYQIENNSIIDFYDYEIGGQYFIRSISGKTLAIDLEPSDTIEFLKEKISDREGIPQNKIKLIYQGVILEDNKTISNYNLKAQSNINMKIK